MTTQVTIDGLPRLKRVLKRVGDLGPVRTGMRSAAVYLKGQLAVYPPVSRRPQPFVSDKQRRGFFAKLRSGEIEVPYRRGTSPQSERLGQSWAIQERAFGLQQIIGNDTSYGALVQGRKQTAYHKETGWQKVEDVARRERDEASRIVWAELDRALREAGG